MKIQLRHSAVDDGVAVTLDVDMTEIRELPPAPYGLLPRMDDANITVTIGSRAHRLLSRFFRVQGTEPMLLVAGDHTGLWFIRSVRMPTTTDDTSVWFTLGFSGRA